MMLDQIIRLLGESEADAWEVTETRTEGWDLYFIRHDLDQNRIRNTVHTTVRVFRCSGDRSMIGSASEELPPTASEEEARELIRLLCERASYVRNPYYELCGPSGDSRTGSEGSDGKQPETGEIAAQFLDVFRSVRETEDTFLNSYEIFVDMKTVRFLNSNGVDVTDTRPQSMLEVVSNARDGKREIELYRIYHSGSADREELARAVEETLRVGRDRLLAVPMPKLGTVPVVFSTSEIREICSFFINRMSASYKKQGYSDWETGKPIMDGSMETGITVEALRELPNSSGNRDFDPEGAPVRDVVQIRDGVAECFLGNRQFSCYLGLEDSFIPGNFRVSGGTYTEDELRTGDFLEAVEFSDFQADALSGDIAGEIRLAYWHHGGTVTPVTGGSISGSLIELAPSMKMSAGLRQYDSMVVPAVVRLENVSVTGITGI